MSIDPFVVPGVEWSRVSPGLTSLRRLVTLAVALVALVALGVVAWWLPASRVLLALLAPLVVATAGWSWWFVARVVGAWGWVERDADLVVTRGRMWRRIDVVPYGRMQLVDVTSGPLERAFGIATVRMHTASPSSQAHLPGLPPDVAGRLRDRLTERGEAMAAGL